MTTRIEHRYFVVRMEVEVDDDGPLAGEYNRVDGALDQLRAMVGYANARKARKNDIVKAIFQQ